MISPVEIEIEIALHAQEKKYEVDLHFDRSDSEADTAPIRGETGLDLEALRALSDDRTEYGKALYQVSSPIRKFAAVSKTDAPWPRHRKCRYGRAC